MLSILNGPFYYKVLWAFMLAWKLLTYVFPFLKKFWEYVGVLTETSYKDWTVLFGYIIYISLYVLYKDWTVLRLDCDGLVAVMAAFRIFLERNYAFLIPLPSISISSFVCPVCSRFCSTDVGLPWVQVKRRNTCCHEVSYDLPPFGSLVLTESK